MRNLAMERKLKSGEAVNVANLGTEVSPGLWVLLVSPQDLLELDWCVVNNNEEEWVWSIGRHLKSGKFYVATDTRLFRNPDYECVWLR
jgi:hypothetical protein